MGSWARAREDETRMWLTRCHARTKFEERVKGKKNNIQMGILLFALAQIRCKPRTFDDLQIY